MAGFQMLPNEHSTRAFVYSLPTLDIYIRHPNWLPLI